MVLVRPGSNRLDPLVLGTDYRSQGELRKTLERRQRCMSDRTLYPQNWLNLQSG